MNTQIIESDWKIFKKLKPLALQRYCERLMGSVDRVINDDQRDAHERYLEMYKIVRAGDKKLALMFNGFSRTLAFEQLMMYYGNGLLTDDEIAPLSDENREKIIEIANMRDERDNEE